MAIFAGTSGYSFKEWKGPFYPEGLPASAMLGYYAARLPAVEINNTFYRLPSEHVLASWAEQVPDGFRFAIKASRRITHLKRLRDVGDETHYLLRTVGTLGARLGPLLFQLPPNLKKDTERLERFLDLLPTGTRVAFEFRHVSWLDADVLERLAERDHALCTSDTDERKDVDPVATASFGYLRLRRPGYDAASLQRWVDRIRMRGWQDAFVFFKHEDDGAGPRLARALLDLT
jgi:uncharacterized protein YecE (DUF72 family)